MRVGLVVGVILGLVGFVVVGAVMRGVRVEADVSESHTVVSATGMGQLVPVGSTVLVQCKRDDGGYLADRFIGGDALVFTVTAAQLDSVPTGPFPESCAHWKQRHHVTKQSI